MRHTTMIIQIPCRTANRGSFPLNGTYFQVNEVLILWYCFPMNSSLLLHGHYFIVLLSTSQTIFLYTRFLLIMSQAKTQFLFRGHQYGIWDEELYCVELQLRPFLKVENILLLVIFHLIWSCFIKTWLHKYWYYS